MGRRDAEPPSWDQLVKIPAVDTEDRLLANLTARQAAQLAAVTVALWLAWQLAQCVGVPPLAYGVVALPVIAASAAAVLTRRDGLSMDRWLAAALRHRASPKRLVPSGRAETPLARLPLPATDVDEHGLLHLHPGGCSVLARVASVNLALRTDAEQRALVGAFGRWLNALSGPAQILVRTQPADLTPLVAALEQNAPALPHPLLEDAAREHAAYLAELGRTRDLLARQVFVVHREERGDPAATTRLRARAAETAQLLGAAEATVSALGPAEMYSVLQTACDPGAPAHPNPALPHQPVTAPALRGDQ
ncbi:PrgI family protein [Streptacidiphilus sp. MAP5-3]|uniref:PrgI family protein n=1 Tax=unclassified Streptacidiphilus TaxID=2643834 RepID=UPI0035172ABE